MSDFGIGFLVALLVAVILAGAYATGKKGAASECERFGAFSLSGNIYECRLKKEQEQEDGTDES